MSERASLNLESRSPALADHRGDAFLETTPFVRVSQSAQQANCVSFIHVAAMKRMWYTLRNVPGMDDYLAKSSGKSRANSAAIFSLTGRYPSGKAAKLERSYRTRAPFHNFAYRCKAEARRKFLENLERYGKLETAGRFRVFRSSQTSSGLSRTQRT